MTVADVTGRWVNAVQAGRILSVSPRRIPALAERGLIAVRSLPVQARYDVLDVLRLAEPQQSPAAAAV